jgi:hypothetical protein
MTFTPSTRPFVSATRLAFQSPATRRAAVGIAAGLTLVFLMSDPVLGVTLEALKEPIKSLKGNVFGGWMKVVQLASLAAGCVVSVYKQSLAPMGLGAGTTLGIHLFDSYLGDGATGALI